MAGSKKIAEDLHKEIQILVQKREASLKDTHEKKQSVRSKGERYNPAQE